MQLKIFYTLIFALKSHLVKKCMMESVLDWERKYENLSSGPVIWLIKESVLQMRCWLKLMKSKSSDNDHSENQNAKVTDIVSVYSK